MEYKLIGDNDYIFDPIGTVLRNRGIEDVDKYLNLDDSVLIPYNLLCNIEKAVDLFLYHLENDSKIFIMVDDDCDGFSSASILYQYIEKVKPNTKIEWRVHEKKAHGIENIDIPNDIQFVVIPDASSSEYETHQKLKERGIDILILDHHEADKESEHAVVVNNQLSPNYNNPFLSATGIVYKFMQAVDDRLNVSYADEFLDIVALGLIADSMKMSSFETRRLVDKGLSNIKNEFFLALLQKQEYSTQGKINPISISYFISPLINAVVRFGNKTDKIDMFRALIGEKELFKHKTRAKGEITETLVENMARRAYNLRAKQARQVAKVLPEIDNIIEDNNLNDNKVIVVKDIETHPSLSGLLAIKVAEKYKKPTFVLSKLEDDIYTGSARGYDKSNINDFKEIVLRTELFEFAQGHPNAYGLGIKKDNLELAVNNINELLSDYKVYDKVDFEISGDELESEFILQLCEHENLWGKGVEEPNIVIKEIPLSESDITLTGKKKDTLRIIYRGIAYMIFNIDELSYQEILDSQEAKLNVLGKADIYNDYPQIKVKKYEITYF